DCSVPATREYSPKRSATTSASASATVQPNRRPAERAADATGSRAPGEPTWCCGDERPAVTRPDTAGRVGRRRRGAWADVASNSSRLTAASTAGDRERRSYPSTSDPGPALPAVRV